MLLGGMVLVLQPAVAQDFEFAALRGSPVNMTGWNLQGAAKVGNTPGATGNSEIILTDPVNTQSGAVFFNTPINLSQCRRWLAEFQFRMFDGNMADGLAFCYLDVPPSGFVSGGGIGIPATANGLKVVLDTWRNCSNDQVPKIQIRWGPGYDECNGQPTRNNNDGALTFLRDNRYNFCRIEYNDGNIRVSINGVEYLSGFQTFNFSGYFGFTASTGGFNDRHSIRNVRIFTEMPPSQAGNSEVGFCPGGSAQLGGSTTPGYTYKWFPTNGLSSSTIANPTITLSHNLPSDQRILYTVETAFDDRPGCASKDSVWVNVWAKPQPDFIPDTGCLPSDDILFRNTTRFDPQPITNLTWQWNFGNPASGAANTSAAMNPAHTYTGNNTFTVQLTATSDKGCVGQTEKIIRPLIAAPVVSYTTEGNYCPDNPIQFIGQIEQFPPVTFRYLYDFGDGSLPLHAPDPIYRYSTGGTYQTSLTVDNGYCPPVTARQVVEIKPAPAIAISPNLPSPCAGTVPIVLSFASVTNGLSGTGRYSGTHVSGNLFLTPQANTGANRIDYTFDADNGCSSTVDFAIVVRSLPNISAGPDKVSLEVKPVQLDGRAGPDLAGFEWRPAAFLSNPRIENPIANPPGDTRYVLFATATNGCVASDSVWVTVLPALFIPNAFSPNGDGINDTWDIRFLDQYPGSQVKVFDRYGKQVFVSTGYSSAWDGTRNGSPIPAGTYYFIIDPKNGATVRQGSVTILR